MFEIIRGEDGIVHFVGRLDASQVDLAEEVMISITRSTSADLSRLDYISSAGISVLLRAFKRLHDEGATLKLVNVSQRIQNVFHYAGLDKIFVIE